MVRRSHCGFGAFDVPITRHPAFVTVVGSAIGLRQLGIAGVEGIITKRFNPGAQQNTDRRRVGSHRPDAVLRCPPQQNLVLGRTGVQKRLELHMLVIAKDEAQSP